MSSHLIPQSDGGFFNPALNAFIEAQHTKENLPKAGLHGVTSAVKIPLHPGTPLSVFVEPIVADYNVLTAKAYEINGGDMFQQAKISINKLDMENVALANEADTVAGDLAIEEKSIGKIVVPEKPTRKLIFAYIVNGIILLADTYLLGSAFQKTGSNLITSFFLGLACSTAIAIVSTLGTKFTERIKSKKVKFLATCIMALLVGLSCYILCAMRSDYYKSHTGGEISAWKLAVLSILVFAAFHLVYQHIIKPGHEQLRLRKEALQKLAKAEELKARLAYLHQTYKANKDKIAEIKRHTLDLFDYARGCEKTIESFYKASISEFKRCFSTEARYIPQCFTQEPPPITLYYKEFPLTPTQTDEKLD